MNHTPGAGAQQLLYNALHYYDLGLSVIPVSRRTKKAAVKWKQHQRRRAEPSQLEVWFRDADAEQVAIAVICGSVSGNLVVRDFDEPGSYDRWAYDNPELAIALPTVSTGRLGGHGRHVWARAPQPLGTKQLSDGHLKGDGGYVVAPPSLHATGTPYTWQSEAWLAQIPVLSLNNIARLIGGEHWNTEVLCSSVSLGAPEAHQQLSESAPASSNQRAIELAIERTLPTDPGQRHKKIFALVRRLKAIPALIGVEPATLEPIFREWHRRALPAIRTQEFAVSFADFLDGWHSVRTPANAGRLARAVERARLAEPPAAAAAFECPELRLLVSHCWELQQDARDQPFFLTCRDAADLVGMTGQSDYKVAWQWLRMLCALGILKCTKHGNRSTANEYRWLNRR